MNIGKNGRTMAHYSDHNFLFHLPSLLIDWMYAYICPWLAAVHISDLICVAKMNFRWFHTKI